MDNTATDTRTAMNTIMLFAAIAVMGFAAGRIKSLAAFNRKALKE